MQNYFDECSFFIPSTPPWSLTREVLECRFHLNDNLKAVSLRLAWLLTCCEGPFALGHSGCVKRWAAVLPKQSTTLSFLMVFQTSSKVFFCFFQVERSLSTVIFSRWQWPQLALRPTGEDEPLWCHLDSRLFLFDWDTVSVYFVTVLPIFFSSRCKNPLEDALESSFSSDTINATVVEETNQTLKVVLSNLKCVLVLEELAEVLTYISLLNH